MAHARLSASAAERWVNCPGSINLIEAMPPDTERRQTSYAYRGTVLHAVARRALQGRPMPPAGASLSEEGGPPYEVTEYDLEGLSLYLTLIREYRKIKPKWEGVEIELDLKGIHKQLGGTADYAALFANGNLAVVDLKTGTGVTVNPENNLQCIQYAMGVWATRKGVKTITIVIVQPWAAYGDTVKSWTLSSEGLMGHALDLMAAAERVNAPDPEIKAGEWCRFCPAISVCPAHVKDFNELVPKAKEMVASLSIEEVGTILSKYNQIKPWLEMVYERGLGLAEQGIPVPYMKLVPKRANRKWKDETIIPSVFKVMGLLEEMAYTKKIVSPAQAEKVCGKTFYQKHLDSLAEKKSSGFNLVPVDDAVKGPDLTPLLPSPKSLGLTK